MSKINQTFKEVEALDGRWIVEDRPWFPLPNPDLTPLPVGRAVEYVIPDPWVVHRDDLIREAELERLLVNGRFEFDLGCTRLPIIYNFDDMTDPPEVDSGPFVVCSKCDQRISPQDSYPVVWIGTKTQAELCEGCFRKEEAAGRARPCKGLDENAT